jgi:hypothetical protein
MGEWYIPIEKLILSLVYFGWQYEHTIGEWYSSIEKLILSLVYLGWQYDKGESAE